MNFNIFHLQILVLYSGPLSEAKVIFPVGEFKLYAEIHEEAGAYATYVINPKFSTVLPDEDDYNNANIEELLKQYSEIGDQDRISQLLQADASIRAKACWFNVTCALGATAAKGPSISFYPNYINKVYSNFIQNKIEGTPILKLAMVKR